ncbi:MAG: hypothetical protein AAB397_04075, partial [Patescibacteria group bacterium]
GIMLDKCGVAYLIGTMAALSWFVVQSFFDTAIYSPIILPILMVIFAINTFLRFNITKQLI